MFLGSLFIYSSSAFVSYFFHKSTFYFYYKQMLGILFATAILFLTIFLKSDLYKKYFVIFYAFVILLNIMTIVPFFSYPINGACRWIRIAGFVFQPSELLKFNYIMSSALIIDMFGDQIKHVLLFFATNFVIHISLLSIQSDFGTIMLFGVTTILLLWNYFYYKKIFIYILSLFFLLIIPLIFLFPYRIARLYAFLDPWEDILGKGFQIIQSLIAFWNGGVWGLGLGNSIQKRLFLPMSYNDFILAIIAEEIGLIGAVGVLGLLLGFSIMIIKMARKLSYQWMQQYCIGFGILMVAQIMINAGAALALLPTKGMGLPLISYGLSSLVGYALMAGVAINFFKQV
jgi:cell division protein FtsW